MTIQEPMTEQPLLPDDTRPRPTWADARLRLETANTFWRATVRSDGRPHVMPILAVWVDGALHFATNVDSRKASNLARDPRCVISTSADTLDLVVEGEAGLVRNDVRLRRVAEGYATKYDWQVTIRDGAIYADGAPTAGPPPYDVYEVKPETIFGFGTDETFSATHWRFQEG